jgi:hypothetical protein
MKLNPLTTSYKDKENSLDSFGGQSLEKQQIDSSYLPHKIADSKSNNDILTEDNESGIEENDNSSPNR